MEGSTIHSRKTICRAILFSITALMLMASGPAVVVAATPEDKCADPQAQQEINYCAAQEFWKLNGELTKAYDEALAYAKKMDQSAPPPEAPDLKTETEALTTAETAWLQYRDAHCDGMGYLARGGTLEPLLVGNCKIELTKNRIKELKDLMTSLED
jgi:uncharacterized protein YecT (DUF1311 family)